MDRYNPQMDYKWDAVTYGTLQLPHLHWGEDLLGRFDFRGDEWVLEAGCGTGRDTEKLLERVPSGRVVALDSSMDMLDVAGERLSGGTVPLELMHADLTALLGLPGCFDLVFSVATLHWIVDQASVYTNFHSVLKTGGVLLADFGGEGNISRVIAAVQATIGETEADGIWNFAGVDTTVELLDQAGFEVLDVHLEDDPARFSSLMEFKVFLRTLILGAHTDQLDDTQKRDFVDEVAARIPEMAVDYVRLKVHAAKGRR